MGACSSVTTQLGGRELAAVRVLEQAVVGHDGGRLEARARRASLGAGRCRALVVRASDGCSGYAGLVRVRSARRRRSPAWSRRTRDGSGSAPSCSTPPAAAGERATTRCWSRRRPARPARAFAECARRHPVALRALPRLGRQPSTRGRCARRAETRPAVESDHEMLGRATWARPSAGVASGPAAPRPRRRTQVIELAGVPVGTLRLER